MGDLTLWDWFDRSVSSYPNAIALDVSGHRLTYLELRRCAEALAARIVEEHGGRPDRIALLANRSVVAFAGYLAAQRLGSTIVPLNPGHPVARNRLMNEQARCEALLVDTSGVGQLDGGLTARTILDLSDEDVLDAPQAAPPAGTSNGVAYLLFTSGSTGRPKGVPITHRNAAAYIAHNLARYLVAPGCRISHTFDLTFDPSVFDLFVTWGGGATLVCPQRLELLTPVDYLATNRITHWFSVPSSVSVAASLGNLPTGVATDLRFSIFIGEQLTYRQARAWREVAPDAVIDNVYGPTELTVACTEYRLPADPAHWPTTSNDTVPIGHVYPHLRGVLLDASGRPARDGELCVRGSQRFDGYLDPADDLGRFTEDGFYRTGDRVRLENGNLVHLGRLDHQVKVRGHRIELGEIEAMLARYPGVTQAVVITVPLEDDVRLVAYYTGKPGPDREITRWLRARLPIHMVPRTFHHLDALPLNANGKTDRGALLDLEGHSKRRPSDGGPPAGVRNRALPDSWQAGGLPERPVQQPVPPTQPQIANPERHAGPPERSAPPPTHPNRPQPSPLIVLNEPHSE